MRHYLCFAVLAFFLYQPLAQAQVDFGVKAGISVPSLGSGSSDNPLSGGYSSRLGPDAAIYFEFHVSPHFSIQPELHYASQGGKKSGNQALATPPDLHDRFPPGEVPPFLFADYKSTVRLNYIMLPVLAKYRFNLNPHWDLYAAAGPFAGALISAKNITKGDGNLYADAQHLKLVAGPVTFDSDEDIKDELRSFNAGISWNIGIAYKWAGSSLFIEGGGNNGFVNIQKDEANGKNRTGAAVLVVGYAVNLSR
jgi:hypothetical protein